MGEAMLVFLWRKGSKRCRAVFRQQPRRRTRGVAWGRKAAIMVRFEEGYEARK
jgi:hypothetical protein